MATAPSKEKVDDLVVAHGVTLFCRAKGTIKAGTPVKAKYFYNEAEVEALKKRGKLCTKAAYDKAAAKAKANPKRD